MTHRQLLQGSCPWCDTLITEGQVETPDDQTSRVWIIENLEADLGDPDCEIRMNTMTNLVTYASLPVNDVLPLFDKALEDADARIRSRADGGLANLGRSLSKAQADELESLLPLGEHECGLRVLLVSFYFLKQLESKVAPTRRNHILWLIEHAPKMDFLKDYCQLLKAVDPEGYRQAKDLWLGNIEANPECPTIIANAASFFVLNDFTLCEQYLKRGLALKPGNPHWPEQLGQLYLLRSHSRSKDGEQHDQGESTKSFAALEKAEELRESQQSTDASGSDKIGPMLRRMFSLSQLAKSAFDASEFECPTNYSTELLSLASSSELPELFRNDGNAVHSGNLILGRVALEMGNIEEAKSRLLASGKTQGSPNLSSFGPNMSLAKGLLELGENAVVLEYFQLCAEFWESDRDSLKSWTEQVRQGKIPEFGPNLIY
jgi:hypothetical protein